MVNPINPTRKRNDERSIWLLYALYSGATLQIAVNIAVFGYLGSIAARHFHQVWWILVGVAFGVFIGGSTFVILVKRLVGETR